MTQVDLAERLGISASYLNLIEAQKRSLPADLLVKLARVFELDLSAFAVEDDSRLVADLMEAFADPLFRESELTSIELREFVNASPNAARSVLTLYRAYQDGKESVESMSSRLEVGEGMSEHASLPSEEVSDLLQKHGNHFPELELAAEAAWKRAKLDMDDLYSGLLRLLETEHGVHVRITRNEAERGTLRRYNPDRKTLTLSELLPTRSRVFQMAHQLGLLSVAPIFEKIVNDAHLMSDSSRALARVALANYFAGALLMPYATFLKAAKEERYDLDVLGRRFRIGFEQVAHRLTTLSRPGAEGVPFHMIRIDVAGNISKRFSGSGIRFARYSGVCARWNVFSAFLTPGMIRIQVSKMTDGGIFFCLARTIQKDSGGYHAQHPVQAIGLGCRVEYARDLVYSDGVDLQSAEAATPVGVTCRLCERTDCEQRVLPSMHQPLTIDENVRGVTLYNPVAQKQLFREPRGSR